MSLLRELHTIVEYYLPVETGVFSGAAPDEYAVIVPMADVYELYLDDLPQYETQEARVSLFSKRNYQHCKRQIVHALWAADITVTDRRYVGHEDDTGYHHYVIDVAKTYPARV